MCEKAQVVASFFARLLDALLAGVQGTLLAFGSLHQFLLRLGLYNANDQQGTNANNSKAHTGLLLLLEGKILLV